MKDKILEVMSKNKHCVISTVGPNGSSQSALVGFSVNDDLEIVFGTNSYTRKYKNILRNPNVSLVISLEEKKLSVQYEGRAEQLRGDELISRVGLHYDNGGAAIERLKDPSQVYFKIVPKWVRFVDANVKPLHFEEEKFS